MDAMNCDGDAVMRKLIDEQAHDPAKRRPVHQTYGTPSGRSRSRLPAPDLQSLSDSGSEGNVAVTDRPGSPSTTCGYGYETTVRLYSELLEADSDRQFSIRESCCSIPKVSSGSFAITLATNSQPTCCNGRPVRGPRTEYGRLTGIMPCIKARDLQRTDRSLTSPRTSNRFWWNASRGMTYYSNRRFAQISGDRP